MSNVSKQVQVLIVGGGIAGLATALSLAQKGYKTHVLERSPVFSEVGAGLQLAPNASRVLDQLGVLDQVHKMAVFPRNILWLDAQTGENINRINLETSFQERYQYPYLVMHRSDLLNTLLEACQKHELICLETDKQVVSIQDCVDFAVANCQDNSSYQAEILIGADGLRSVVRDFLSTPSEPICSHYVAYRGTIPIEHISSQADLDNVLMWIGPNMHLVQYPVRKGELYNQVAVFRSEHYDPTGDEWGTPEEMQQHFANSCTAVQDALPLLSTNKRWPLFDRLPLEKWTQNRIALIGDAAHPMLQYLAQGAAQALEDVSQLTQCLGASHNDPTQALQNYAALRLPHTARVQHSARIFGEIIHMEPVGAKVRNQLLASRQPDNYDLMDWLYAERV